MNHSTIPIPVISVVSDVLGSYYYSHTGLNTLFEASGAPGEPPIGNCVEKCKSWLKRCNSDTSIPFQILGRILREFMEENSYDPFDIDLSVSEDKRRGREKINKILSENGLSYQKGGQIIGVSSALSTRTLLEILKEKDLHGIEQEFQRALKSVEVDPPAALTAACCIVESLCKTYIEDEKLIPPTDQSIKPLWNTVSKHLGFNPSLMVDDDLKKILSGLISIVDGIGALRTHAGSAHGRGRKSYKIKARHARLAIHTAHTLCIYIIETWEKNTISEIHS